MDTIYLITCAIYNVHIGLSSSSVYLLFVMKAFKIIHYPLLEHSCALLPMVILLGKGEPELISPNCSTASMVQLFYDPSSPLLTQMLLIIYLIM